ncbi:hypothetical protein [Shewanella piezotolerans]|nr:hypothetical protein [Shewanella piezotolerans]
MNWIWFGALLMMIGGLTTIFLTQRSLVYSAVKSRQHQELCNETA